MTSSERGMTLQEVLIAMIIISILSPVVHNAYTYAVKVQAKRALQEETLIFAANYIELVKFNILTDPEEIPPLDSIRIFRGDTLFLKRISSTYETEGLLKEKFSIVFDEKPIVIMTHLIHEPKENSLWK